MTAMLFASSTVAAWLTTLALEGNKAGSKQRLASGYLP
jgi:hypothetical protein